MQECLRNGENEDVPTSPRATGKSRSSRLVLGFYRSEEHGGRRFARPARMGSGARV